MVLAKINISNEEEDYYFELDIDCPNVEDVDIVTEILKKYNEKRVNRFNGSDGYIKELERKGYSAKEVEYHIEI